VEQGSQQIYGMEITMDEKLKKELGYDSDLIIDEEDFQKLNKLP
jgi:hypothetical protein